MSTSNIIHDDGGGYCQLEVPSVNFFGLNCEKLLPRTVICSIILNIVYESSPTFLV